MYLHPGVNRSPKMQRKDSQNSGSSFDRPSQRQQQAENNPTTGEPQQQAAASAPQAGTTIGATLQAQAGDQHQPPLTSYDFSQQLSAAFLPPTTEPAAPAIEAPGGDTSKQYTGASGNTAYTHPANFNGAASLPASAGAPLAGGGGAFSNDAVLALLSAMPQLAGQQPLAAAPSLQSAVSDQASLLNNVSFSSPTTSSSNGGGAAVVNGNPSVTTNTNTAALFASLQSQNTTTSSFNTLSAPQQQFSGAVHHTPATSAAAPSTEGTASLLNTMAFLSAMQQLVPQQQQPQQVPRVQQPGIDPNIMALFFSAMTTPVPAYQQQQNQVQQPQQQQSNQQTQVQHITGGGNATAPLLNNMSPLPTFQPMPQQSQQQTTATGPLPAQPGVDLNMLSLLLSMTNQAQPQPQAQVQQPTTGITVSQQLMQAILSQQLSTGGMTSQQQPVYPPAPATRSVPPAAVASAQYHPPPALPVLPPRKKPKRPRPRRPLNAYNIFFKDERTRIIAENSETYEAEHDETAHTSLDTKRQRRRRPHGKVGFEDMAKIIGKRWKEITPEHKAYYDEGAKAEKKRYHDELALCQREENEEREAIRDALEASVSDQTKRDYFNGFRNEE